MTIQEMINNCTRFRNMTETEAREYCKEHDHDKLPTETNVHLADYGPMLGCEFLQKTGDNQYTLWMTK